MNVKSFIWVLLQSPFLFSCLGSPSPDSATHDSSISSSNPQGCSTGSQEILANGIFDPEAPLSLTNHLIAATLAHNAYPYSMKGISIEETASGLSDEKNEAYQQFIRNRWTPLGAKTIEFVESVSRERRTEGHALILGTSKDVYLVYRGTSYLSQFVRALRQVDIDYVIAGKRVKLWETAVVSFDEIYNQVENGVKKAIKRTDSPSTARLWIMGHSLGGSHATMAAIKLTERNPEIKIAGVYTFGSNMTGFDCASGETCWTRLYDEKFGRITYRWVNDLDVAPFLPVKAADHQDWGSVPLSHRPMFRIVGRSCGTFFGTETQNCPRFLSREGGPQVTKGCDASIQDHLSVNYVQKIGNCAVASVPEDLPPASSGQILPKVRWNECTRKGLLTDMLGVRY